MAEIISTAGVIRAGSDHVADGVPIPGVAHPSRFDMCQLGSRGGAGDKLGTLRSCNSVETDRVFTPAVCDYPYVGAEFAAGLVRGCSVQYQKDPPPGNVCGSMRAATRLEASISISLTMSLVATTGWDGIPQQSHAAG